MTRSEAQRNYDEQIDADQFDDFVPDWKLLADMSETPFLKTEYSFIVWYTCSHYETVTFLTLTEEEAQEYANRREQGPCPYCS